MDYVLIGSGFFAVTVAAGALWFGLRRYHKQMEAERKRELAKRKRAAKTAAADNSNLYAGLNGTDSTLYGRREP